MRIVREKSARSALLRSLPYLLMSVVAVLTGWFVFSQAHADSSATGVKMSVVKLQDGTGTVGSDGLWAKDGSSSFINSANGYSPADDGPKDGVVASGDTVLYTVNLSFSAGDAREVSVKPSDVSASLSVSLSGLCKSSGSITSAKLASDGSCVLSIPSGSVSSVSGVMTVTAKSTGGKAETNQGFTLQAYEGSSVQASASFQESSLTVVSAPAVDLVVGRAENTAVYQEKNTKATGSVTLTPTSYQYQQYSNKKGGIDPDLLGYTAKVDVSSFPSGVTWSDGSGTALTPSNGVITVSAKGVYSLQYTFPADDSDSWPSGSGTNNTPETNDYDLGVTVVSGSFQAEGGLPNAGSGAENGSADGKNVSTADASKGTLVGWSYPNNNWVKVSRIKKVYYAGGSFHKEVSRPYSGTDMYTYYDAENMEWSKATGSSSSVPQVAKGTQLTSQIVQVVDDSGIKNYTRRLLLGDSWNSKEQQFDTTRSVVVKGPDGNAVDPSLYTVQWSKSNLSKDEFGEIYEDSGANLAALQWWNATGWFSTSPSTSAQMVRVIFNDDTYTAAHLGSYTLEVPLVVAQTAPATADGSTPMTDYGFLAQGYQTDGSGNKTAQVRGGYTVNLYPVKPDPDRSWTLAMAVSGMQHTDSDGVVKDVQPDSDGTYTASAGDEVTYKLTPGVTGVTKAAAVLNPTVKVVMNPLTQGPFTNKSTDDWTMTVDPSDATGRTLLFTFKEGGRSFQGNYDPLTGTIKDGVIPAIEVSGTVMRGSSDKTVRLATGKVTEPANEDEGVTPRPSETEQAQYLVTAVSGKKISFTANQTPVEADSDIAWTYDAVSGETGTDSADFLLRMPSNDATVCASLSAQQSTGYSGGCSKYTGSWTLKSITQSSDQKQNSTDVVYYYSVANASALNVTDAGWNWQKAGSLSDLASAVEGKAITALRISAATDDAGVAAAQGTITLSTAGNKATDRYVMWISPLTGIASGAATGTPTSVPYAVPIEVVTSSVSGTVWWDDDGDGARDDDEPGISSLKVSLYKADQVKSDGSLVDGASESGTTTTDANGAYSFSELKSGDYVVRFDRTNGDSAKPLIADTTTTYYHQSADVMMTQAWRDQQKTDLAMATDTSDPNHWIVRSDGVTTSLGSQAENVDFGFQRQDPRVEVTKTNKKLDCPTDASKPCTATWEVGIKNSGNTGLDKKTSSIVDRTSNNVSPLTVQSMQKSDFTQISAGSGYALALSDDGSVWAWGKNYSVGFGDGTTIARTSPIQVQGLAGKKIVQVSAGGGYSALALADDGSVWAWGNNSSGQLGDGTTTKRTSPVQVQGLEGKKAVQVYASVSSSYAVMDDGSVWAWGSNGNGRLGDGTTTSRTSPVKVLGLDGVKITQIVANNANSIAVANDGSVWTWGREAIAGSTVAQSTTAVRTTIPGDRTITEASANSGTTMVLASDGTVWVWGLNQGQHGNGTTQSSSTPVQVTSLSDKNITHISEGTVYGLVMASDGTVWGAGNNSNGQIGSVLPDTSSMSVTTYKQVPEVQGKSVKSIATSLDTQVSYALLSDGSIFAWGTNKYGTFGNGTSMQESSVSTKNDSGVPNIAQSAMGDKHVVALASDGTVWAWGANESGQLGDGTTTDRAAPAQVQIPGNRTITQVAAGSAFSEALASDGTVWAWGSNSTNQLGDGTTTNRLTPVQVQGLSGKSITKISAGGSTSLALASDGTAWGWGRNTIGEIGDGTKQKRSSAVRAGSGKLYSELSTSSTEHSLGLGLDGTVWAWGNNGSGELGSSSTAGSVTTAVAMEGLDGLTITHVSAGSYASLVVASDGSVWTVGDNSSGQLGNGTTTNSSVPVKVSGLDGEKITQASMGPDFATALADDGTVWAWGDNYAGQLGDGTTANRTAPVKVVGASDASVVQVVAGGSPWTSSYRDALFVTSDGKMMGAGSRTYTLIGVPHGTIDPPSEVYGEVSPSAVEKEGDGIGDFTARTFAMNSTLKPGKSTYFKMTGTVYRDTAAGYTANPTSQYAVNQVWFTSDQTPVTGAPGVQKAGKSVPDKPDVSTAANIAGITVGSGVHVKGNLTCVVPNDTVSVYGDTYKSDQHVFASNGEKDVASPENWSDWTQTREDSCDQVAYMLPVVSVAPVVGSVSGVVWDDTNADGVYGTADSPAETGHARVKVELLGGTDASVDTSATPLAQTLTSSDGSYSFPNLEAGYYRVRFTKPSVAGGNVAFTKTGGDSLAIASGAEEGLTLTSAPTYTAQVSSTQEDHPDVDAGLIVRGASLKATKYATVKKSLSAAATADEDSPILADPSSEGASGTVDSTNVLVPLGSDGTPQDQQVTTVLTNNGTEPISGLSTEALTNLTVSDETIGGSQAVLGQCSTGGTAVSATSSGSATSAGSVSNLNVTLSPGQSLKCTYKLQMNSGELHQDKVTFAGTGKDTGTAVSVTSNVFTARADVPVKIHKSDYEGKALDLDEGAYQVAQCDSASTDCASASDAADTGTEGSSPVLGLANLTLHRDPVTLEPFVSIFKVSEQKAPAGYAKSKGYLLVTVSGNSANGSMTSSVSAADGAEPAKSSVVGQTAGASPTSPVSVRLDTVDPPQLSLQKTQRNPNIGLAGAKFRLCASPETLSSPTHTFDEADCVDLGESAADGTGLSVPYFPSVGSDGVSALDRMFVLQETATPDGYVPPEGDFLVTYQPGGWEITMETPLDSALDVDGNTLAVKGKIGESASDASANAYRILNLMPPAVGVLPFTASQAFAWFSGVTLPLLALGLWLWRRSSAHGHGTPAHGHNAA